jgi:hypothetical protein
MTIWMVCGYYGWVFFVILVQDFVVNAIDDKTIGRQGLTDEQQECRQKEGL